MSATSGGTSAQTDTPRQGKQCLLYTEFRTGSDEMNSSQAEGRVGRRSGNDRRPAVVRRDRRDLGGGAGWHGAAMCYKEYRNR